MPTKRRVIIFLIVLTVMLLLKRAVGQEPVGWDHTSCWGCTPSAEEEASAMMIAGIVFGIVSGFLRVATRAAAAREGRYFTGDLIQLQLR